MASTSTRKAAGARKLPTTPTNRAPPLAGRAGSRTSPRTAPSSPALPPRAATPKSIHLGDALKVERRYVVDGVLTCITDTGRFSGVQQIGSSEHLVLEDMENGVRMIPLPTIAEIVLLEPRPEEPEAAAQPSPPSEADPSFA